MTLDCARAFGNQRRFYVLQHGEPGEEREALKDDGDVRDLAWHGLAMPFHFARRRGGEPGQHAQQRGFAGTGRAEQCDDLARIDAEVRRRNHLDAIAVRLRIVFLDRAGFDDRLEQRKLLSLRPPSLWVAALHDNRQECGCVNGV